MGDWLSSEEGGVSSEGGGGGAAGSPLSKPVVSDSVCENSCELEGECVPIGYRTETEFCDLGYVFSAQRPAGDKCLNSFECDSNFCSSGKCVDAGLFRKMLNWFKNLFG